MNGDKEDKELKTKLGFLCDKFSSWIDYNKKERRRRWTGGIIKFGFIMMLLFYFGFMGFMKNDLVSPQGKFFHENYVRETATVDIAPSVMDSVRLDEEFKKLGLEGEELKEALSRSGTFVLIPLSGPIFPGIMQEFVDRLRIAVRTIGGKADAIILVVQSPGGEVNECDTLQNQISRINVEGDSHIPIVVFINGIGASGAYYISAGANAIIASPTSLVGSIGVVAQFINVKGLMDKVGIEVVTIRSSSMKGAGSLFRKMSKPEQEMLQSIIDHMQNRFVEVVWRGRGLSMKEVLSFADGRIFTADQAKELKLIDEVGYLRDAVLKAQIITKIGKPTLVRYERKVSFTDRLTNVAEQSASERNGLWDKAIPVPGKFDSPRFLYQWIP